MKILENENNYTVLKEDNGDVVLISYTTPMIRLHKGKYYLLSNYYSAITTKHMNKFLNKKITKSYLLTLKVGDII